MLRTAAANGGQGVRAGSTGASGAFAFENLSAENYLISAQRNGFVRQDGVRSPAARLRVQGITVVAGQDM